MKKITIPAIAISTAVVAAFVAAFHPSWVGLSGFDRSGNAHELRGALAALPGVEAATLEYSKPVVMDSGKLQLTVDMAADADPSDVVDVVKTAYEGFSGAHHGEEGDLDVAIGGDTVHLRSFQPDAEVGSVKEAAQRAIAVLDAGSVRVDINTQEVDKPPHVNTTYAVTIPEQNANAVLRTMNELERAHGDIPDAGWSVQTGEEEAGWQLKSRSGFPDSEQRALFNELRTDDPRGTAIGLDNDYVTAKVPVTATPDEVSAMAKRHLALLGGVKKAFYDVTVGEYFHVLISQGQCTFAQEKVGDRLRKEFGDECTKVTVASP